MANDPDRFKAQTEVAAVNAALAAGHPPAVRPGTSTVRSAVRVAADHLGAQRLAFTDRVGTPARTGAWKRKYGLEPDWSLYRQPPASPPEIEPPVDPVETARQKIQGRDLAAENRRLVEALIEAQDIRGGVLKLLDPPLRPRLEQPKRGTGKGRRTVIIHLSDWHCGERVSLEEMDGINSYSLDICRARVARLGAAAKALLTKHWTGRAVERIIVILGGDLISGEIHDELAKTNDALAAPAVRAAAEHLGGLIKLLRGLAPVDVYSLPGNHGRLTRKPESKGMAINSFDALIAHVVEMMLAEDRGTRFYHSQSGDCLFRVYGWTFCAAHGDRIGSRGGQGFIGPVATITRGLAKTRAYYAGQGVVVDYVLIGHFHTTSKLPRGFSNGSLVGPSEYSRDLRAEPEPAKQTLLVVHSELGVIDYRELFCGDPAEGAIYRPRSVA